MSTAERYELLTLPEAADYLGIKVRTVRDWIRKGFFPAIRLGRRVRVDLADVNTYIDSHRCGS